MEEFESCEPELAGALAVLINEHHAAARPWSRSIAKAESLLSNYRRNGGTVEFDAMAAAPAHSRILTLEETENGYLVADNTGPTPSRVACETLQEGLTVTASIIADLQP